MKRYLFLLSALLCAGCSPVVTKVNVTDMVKSESVQMQDVRPASEKVDKIFSLLITSKEYGVMRWGDARLSPTSMRLLQHEAFQELAAADRPLKITVSHFVIYGNMRAQFRSGAAGGAVAGLAGALIANEIASHDASFQTQIVDETAFNSVTDEYLRGTYSSTENPDKASVYIIYIDTDIDGKKIFTRTIASMKPHDDKNPFADAVQLAIKNHLSQYKTGMATALTVPNATIAPAMTSPTVHAAPEALETVSAGSIAASMAQRVADQLGCGAIRPDGSSSFVASCGTYDVAINCDNGKCYPTHSISTKGNP